MFNAFVIVGTFSTKGLWLRRSRSFKLGRKPELNHKTSAVCCHSLTDMLNYIGTFGGKTALLCIPKECGKASRPAWISRRWLIRVILGGSVSSAVLTWLPGDGELARFNHPFHTNTDCNNRSCCRGAGAWMQRRDSPHPQHATGVCLTLRRNCS